MGTPHLPLFSSVKRVTNPQILHDLGSRRFRFPLASRLDFPNHEDGEHKAFYFKNFHQAF